MAEDPNINLKVKVPLTITTYENKHEYLELVREKVRREHNTKGAEFLDKKITEAEWEKYKAEIFGPRNEAVSMAICDLRAEKKDAARAKTDDDADMAALKTPDCFEDKVANIGN